MVHGLTLALRKLDVPAGRWLCGGTVGRNHAPRVSKETCERQAAELRAWKPRASAPKAPQFAYDHLEIARLVREEVLAFRARRRAWRAGADRAVRAVFRGMGAVSK